MGHGLSTQAKSSSATGGSTIKLASCANKASVMWLYQTGTGDRAMKSPRWSRRTRWRALRCRAVGAACPRSTAWTLTWSSSPRGAAATPSY
jgi:hypothetical protein